MTNRGRRRSLVDGDGGASAVEFALVLPLLVLLVFGIVEFGRAYNAKVSLSAAAREGARVMAIENDKTEATNAAIAAAPTLSIDAGDITFIPASCSPGDAMKVTIKHDLSYDIPLFNTGTFTLTGIGVMRCGG